MIFETKEILITVKAYPARSKKYSEIVCVAGIDTKTGKWVRLYPIPYRDLEDEKKFKKYNIIQADVSKSTKDNRPESYKVDVNSIKIIDYLDPRKDKWLKRKELVLSTLSASFCDILEESAISKKSLGVFKPKDVSFDWEKSYKKDLDKTKLYYSQLSFFNSQKNVIDAIPYTFRYKFKCNNSKCKGHILPIIDWEIGQAFRSWGYKYKGEDLLLNKIKEKFLYTICSDKNDYYFYVGNMHRFQNQFMILGIFYPPF